MTETVIQHNAYISRCRRRLHAGRGGQCYNAQSATWVARRSCTSSQETQCYSNHAETNTRTRTAPCAIWMTAAFVARSTCQIAIMFAFVLVAALIGGYLLFNVLDAVRGGTARAQASVEENLSREVSYDLPALTSYITLNDDEIKQAVADAGLTVIDKGGMSDDPEAALELIKLPSDVSELDAGLMYNKGVSKLSASEAALLLNGSWTLDADRSDGTSMRLRYADFSSGSLDAAIDAAIAAEGFDPATIAEDGMGVDEVGNTFKQGTVDVDGTAYTWKVSALPLSEMYDISGLPETAVYVGVRLSS